MLIFDKYVGPIIVLVYTKFHYSSSNVKEVIKKIPTSRIVTERGNQAHNMKIINARLSASRV